MTWPAADSGDAVANSVAGIFLQYGVLGAVALTGLWFVWKAYRRETERADKADAANAKLNEDLREKVIPILTDATRATADMVVALRDVTAALRERR